MAADRDRFSTAARLKALGGQAAAKVYRARPKRRSRLTGRAALLALVVCSLVVALAYPMRQWVSQQSEIAEQQREAERAREAVEELRDQKARWQDPAYVEQQVRERLHYLRPGETGYIVPGASDSAGDRDGGGADGTARRSGYTSSEGRTPGDRPWYRDLWDGVDRADAARG